MFSSCEYKMQHHRALKHKFKLWQKKNTPIGGTLLLSSMSTNGWSVNMYVDKGKKTGTVTLQIFNRYNQRLWWGTVNTISRTFTRNVSLYLTKGVYNSSATFTDGTIIYCSFTKY